MVEESRLKYIGVKELGDLKKEDFCPRCFWYERHFGPFPSIFPGIFNVIDKNLKNSVLGKERKLPAWLKIDNPKRILTADRIEQVKERSQQKYLVADHKKVNLF